MLLVPRLVRVFRKLPGSCASHALPLQCQALVVVPGCNLACLAAQRYRPAAYLRRCSLALSALNILHMLVRVAAWRWLFQSRQGRGPFGRVCRRPGLAWQAWQAWQAASCGSSWQQPRLSSVEWRGYVYVQRGFQATSAGQLGNSYARPSSHNHPPTLDPLRPACSLLHPPISRPASHHPACPCRASRWSSR